MNTLEPRGVISFFARHPVAGNLVMLLMVMFGLYGLNNITRQVLPDFELDLISVSVQWPGASPEDVESNILEAIEPEVRFLDNVDRVDSIAYEGRAQVTIRFDDDVNLSKALTDVQAAIARINTFPADIERPVINQVVQTDKVCRIEVSGPYSEQALKRVARRIRDDLLDRGMSRVELLGARDAEIWVEVSEESLRRLDLTLEDVAARIQRSSLDLPSGTVESGGVSRQIRSESLARTARDVGDIEVVSETSGEKLRVRDIARITETFDANEVSHLVDGGTSIGLDIRRSKGLDSMIAQQAVVDYLEDLRAELPPTLQVDLFDVFADQATQRVRMLLSNGLGGLALVLVILFIFLNGRVAFWVAMGIPISIMATLGAMVVLDMTLNMISMFAIIMGLGIIVDDAIVVGEHTEMLHRRGMSPEEATMTAAKVMFAPVMAASLTTIAAFFPILTLGKEIGAIIRELPLTVIIVIAASLIECFLVLPMHLKHALKRIDDRPKKLHQSRFKIAFNRFRDNRFSQAVSICFERRYSTVLVTVCAFLVAFTLLTSGRVGFEFFASPETDMIFGNFALTPGAPRQKTAEMVEEMARALHVVEDRLTGGRGGLVNYELGSVGATEGREGESPLTGDHAGAYTVELVSGDFRDVRTNQVIQAWEAEIRPVSGIERLNIYELSAGGPPGRDLDIRLHGAELDVLKAAAMDLREGLMNIPGVLAIQDDLPHGKEEIVMELTRTGKAMGFTTQSVAQQVRDSFEGAIAKRFSQDQEETIVRVKLSRDDTQRTGTIRELYLRASDGAEVPLTEVVRLKTEVGYSQIHRENGLRQVSVSADVDSTVTTTNVVLATVARELVSKTQQKYGINIEFKGKAEEQQEAANDTLVALMIAVMTMYIILAWVFSSYTTPLVVMSVIPFGFVGAVAGHFVMGYNLNMLSLQALLGLAGVMINDSIILVTSLKRLIARGESLSEAVVVAARERLRPVILTTLTTIGGLTPLLFERSLQAQLIQPLAVTLIFGLLFSPLLVLFFVPSLLGIGNDLRFRFGRDQSVQQDAAA
jgi:multidrug efflux pump subunit AcrB